MYFMLSVYQLFLCVLCGSYNRVSFSDDSGEHRLELGSFLVHNLTPNTPAIYQVRTMYISHIAKSTRNKNLLRTHETFS